MDKHFHSPDDGGGNSSSWFALAVIGLIVAGVVGAVAIMAYTSRHNAEQARLAAEAKARATVERVEARRGTDRGTTPMERMFERVIPPRSN